jgi:hypothetical protein
MIQRIVCAAVQFPDGKVYLGARHHNALARAREDGQTGDGKEGFIDSREVFHSRRSAFKHAKAGGQIRRREGPAEYAGDELFSEDLY